MSVPKTKIIPEINHSHLEIIRGWLFKIGEPEKDHQLILDKCNSDAEAMEYFLMQASGRFEG